MNYTAESAKALADEFYRIADLVADIPSQREVFMDAADALMDAVDLLNEQEPS